MNDEYISEQRRQYTNDKTIDTSVQRNPPIKCNALHFMQDYENKNLRLAPKPLQVFKSVYKDDFNAAFKVQEQEIPAKSQKPIIAGGLEKLTIDRSKVNHAKHLDTAATSNRLDYYHFSFDQQRGIGAKDNITYWTWIKDEANRKYNVWPMKQNLAGKLGSKKKLKSARRGEFQILQNSVPNRGLTTETKSNYQKPDRSIEYDFECICNQLN